MAQENDSLSILKNDSSSIPQSDSLSALKNDSLVAQPTYLFLSGGQKDAIFHLGVLKGFEKYQVPVHEISGSSWGALIAAFWACGYSSEEILEIFQKENALQYMNPAKNGQRGLKFKEQGLFGFEKKYQVLIDEKLGQSSIDDYYEELEIIQVINKLYFSYLSPRLASGEGKFEGKIPFTVFASHLNQADPYIIQGGDLRDALLKTLIPVHEYLANPLIQDKVFDGNIKARLPLEFLIKNHPEKWLLISNSYPRVSKDSIIDFSMKYKNLTETSYNQYPDNGNLLFLQAHSWNFKKRVDYEEYNAKGLKAFKNNLDWLFIIKKDLGEYGIATEEKGSVQAIHSMELGNLYIHNAKAKSSNFVRSIYTKYKAEKRAEKEAPQVYEFLQLLSEIEEYYNFTVELKKGVQDHEQDLVISFQERDVLKLHTGGFGGVRHGVNAFLGVDINTINYFKFDIQLLGWLGKLGEGSTLDIHSTNFGASDLFLGYKIGMNNQYFSRTNELEDLDPLIKKQNFQNFYGGIQKEKNSRYLIDVNYYEDEWELKNSPYQLKISGLDLHLSWEYLNQNHIGNIPLQTRFYIDNSFSSQIYTDSIQSSAPLYQSHFIQYKEYFPLEKDLLLYANVRTGAQWKLIKYRVIFPPAENLGEGMARYYKYSMVDTDYSRYRLHGKYNSHLFTGTALGLAKILNQNAKAQLNLHYAVDYEVLERDKYADHHVILEGTFDFYWKSFNTTLFVERDFTLLKDYHVGFRVGTYPF